MIEIKDVAFSHSIGVIYALKENHKCHTLQETYKILEESDMDTMLEVLTISYNKAHKGQELSIEQFMETLGESIGLIKLTETYQKVIEGLMFSGLTPAEVESRKNAVMNLKK